MPNSMTRRVVATGLLAAALGAPAARAEEPSFSDAERALAGLERRYGGRLGVCALDTGSGRRIAYRAGERFPMCSTFKWLAAAAVLRRVDAGTERLDRRVFFGRSDLLSYAPRTGAHLSDGMTVGELCAGAIEWSDNTAANLLLRSLGGPDGVTRFARSLGDAITRLDRTEPTLNTALPGDERDTTTPDAIVHDLGAVLLGSVLSPDSTRQLRSWLVADQVGGRRLRAGVPPSWIVGDKTGTGDNGTVNDVGVLWPPDRPPILVASYCTGATGPTTAVERVHADIARLVVRSLAPS